MLLVPALIPINYTAKVTLRGEKNPCHLEIENIEEKALDAFKSKKLIAPDKIGLINFFYLLTAFGSSSRGGKNSARNKGKS